MWPAQGGQAAAAAHLSYSRATAAAGMVGITQIPPPRDQHPEPPPFAAARQIFWSASNR